MKRIDVAVEMFKGLDRTEIIKAYCPYIVMNSYRPDSDCCERGCEGTTCRECWEKEY